jgi:hypothetical protein
MRQQVATAFRNLFDKFAFDNIGNLLAWVPAQAGRIPA